MNKFKKGDKVVITKLTSTLGQTGSQNLPLKERAVKEKTRFIIHEIDGRKYNLRNLDGTNPSVSGHFFYGLEDDLEKVKSRVIVIRS